MPYELGFLSSFERDVKAFDANKKEIIKLCLKALVVYFSSGNNLSQAHKIAPRFFFKQLRKPFYEIGIEGQTRIILRKEGVIFFAMLAGNHDQVRRFLSRR